MAEDKAVLNMKEVAEYLHVHPMTVYKYAKAGKLPAFKIGTDWRFYKKSIDKWIRKEEKSNACHVRHGANDIWNLKLRK